MIKTLEENSHKKGFFLHIYQFEEDLVKLILKGDLAGALEIYENFLEEEAIYQIISSDCLRSLKNYLISLNSLISNRIIEKGVSAYRSKLALQNFSQLIESAKNKQELMKVARQMIRCYSRQINKTIIKLDNSSIKQAINYINDNLEEELTLAKVSDYLGINRCYFCSQFKECTNMSFTEYVSYRRIEESKYYLSKTNLSILDVAISVGFNSQSYFSTQFKKYNRMTPKEYRDQNSRIEELEA